MPCIISFLNILQIKLTHRETLRFNQRLSNALESSKEIHYFYIFPKDSFHLLCGYIYSVFPFLLVYVYSNDRWVFFQDRKSQSDSHVHC